MREWKERAPPSPLTLNLICTGSAAGTKVETGRCMTSWRLAWRMGSVSSEAAGVACLHSCSPGHTTESQRLLQCVGAQQ